jgi:subtilase family serine protease
MKATWFDCLAVICAAVLLPALGASAQAERPVPGPPPGEAHPPLHVHRFSATRPAGYSPAQVRHAYGFDNVAATGAGQTIAIVDAYGSPTIQSDLNTFCTQFGLPNTTVQIYYPTGTPRKADGGWALETSLDVEWAHAIAPGATILLVVAKSAQFNDLLPAVDYAAAHASQVSMSWGASEFSGETSYDFHFIKPGVTFTVSSGDNGAGVEWPAASPYVVAVGGTSLSLDGSGNRIGANEVAWSGSGGGISKYEPYMFQGSVSTSSFREVPDVSYNADPNTGVAIYDSTPYNGSTGWYQIGGTSAGAPQWAAAIALANAGRPSPSWLNNTASLLYSLNNSSYFRDIVSGSNGYPAGTGYDLVTGIGSPVANSLVAALTAK